MPLRLLQFTPVALPFKFVSEQERLNEERRYQREERAYYAAMREAAVGHASHLLHAALSYTTFTLLALLLCCCLCCLATVSA